MATAQNPASLGTTSTTRTAQPAGSLRFDWLYTLLGTWLIGGVFLDGWAHTHGKVDKSFFTPWHAILYSGYLAVAIFLAVTLVRNHAKGHVWLKAVPPGYGASVVGAAIFAIGGVGDLLWHTIFGIEKGIEGEISPSHLTLALGAFLMLSGPLRAAWRQRDPDAARRWATLLPALLSLVYLFSLLVFFTQFADPITHSRADLNISQIVIFFSPTGSDTDTTLSTKLGVASILLQSAIMMGIVLLAVRRWRLPVGSFALIFALNGLLVSFLAGNAPALATMLLSGLIGLAVDLLNLLLKPSEQNALGLRVFAFVVPVVNYVVYFAALLVISGGIYWSVHLWTGSIVMAGIVGVLLSYLLVPPQVTGSSQNR